MDNVQVSGLHCQTAMWTAAMAFALAKGYSTISADYRHTSPICTGSVIFIEDLKRIAGKHTLSVDTPIWDVCPPVAEWSVYRALELAQYGLQPVALEPSCMFARSPSHHIRDVATPLNGYFNAHLVPIMESSIPKLREVFRKLQLSTKDSVLKAYQLPGDFSGLY